MRLVAPLLAVEVDVRVAFICIRTQAGGAAVTAIAGADRRIRIARADTRLEFLGALRDFDRRKALVARVCPDQSPVSARMEAHQASRHRLLHGIVKELLHEAGLVEAPPAILTERGCVPGNRVHAQSHEPAESHVAAQLHGYLPFARDPHDVPGDERQEQLLGRDRRTTGMGIERAGQFPDRFGVDEWPDATERMVFGNEILGGNVVHEKIIVFRSSNHGISPRLGEFYQTFSFSG